jgi:hypothetical protein
MPTFSIHICLIFLHSNVQKILGQLYLPNMFIQTIKLSPQYHVPPLNRIIDHALHMLNLPIATSQHFNPKKGDCPIILAFLWWFIVFLKLFFNGFNFLGRFMISHTLKGM